MEFEVLLNKWGLSSYIPAFEDEGINDESFPLLDEETIKLIFTKKGPFLLFKKKYSDYLGTILASSVDLALVENVSTASTETASSHNSSHQSIDEYSFESDESFFENLSPGSNCNKITDDSDLNISNTCANDVFKVPVQLPFKRSLNVAGCSGEPAKRPKSTIPFDTRFPNGLERYLESHPDGRLALLNREKLNNLLRQKLAKMCVNYLVSKTLENPIFEIKAETFQQVAREIVMVFPSEEIETYYVPFVPKKNGLRQPARGKLWSRYINVRAALRTAEVRTKLPEQLPVEANRNDPNLIFLKAAVEPETKVIEAWEETRGFRSLLYKDASLEDIYQDFPALSTPLGITLLEADFNAKHEEQIDIIYSQWPKVATAIISEAKERHIHTFEESEADLSTRALLTLPSLFSLQTIKRSLKNTWRPTRIEVQESYFYLEKTVEDLNVNLQRRKVKMQDYDVPLQPFAVAVGQLNNIDCFYVVINDFYYRCESSIRCLELLYKAIHALNLHYPSESKSIFLFIQDVIFKMGGVGKSGSTAGVIGDITYQLDGSSEEESSSFSSEDRSRRKRYVRKGKSASPGPVNKRRRVIESTSSSSEDSRDPPNTTPIPNKGNFATIFGDDPLLNKKLGPLLDSDIVVRWSSYLAKGFGKECRELWSKVPFPENCPTLEGPKLNPEIEAILSSSDIKKDTVLLGIQSKIGKGLASLGYALQHLIKNKPAGNENEESTHDFVEASKMFCEAHFLLSNHRRHQIVPSIKDAAALKVASEAISDTWLFGKDFSQKSKDAHALKKVVADMGLKKTPTNWRDRPSTSQASLNFRRHYPKTKMKFSTENFAKQGRARNRFKQEQRQRYRRDRKN